MSFLRNNFWMEGSTPVLVCTCTCPYYIIVHVLQGGTRSFDVAITPTPSPTSLVPPPMSATQTSCNRRKFCERHLMNLCAIPFSSCELSDVGLVVSWFSVCHHKPITPFLVFLVESILHPSNMRSLTLLVLLASLAVSQSLAPLRPSTTQRMASISADNGGIGVSWDWEQVTSDVFISDQRPIILFDGKCNLCNGGVNFALDHDEKGKINGTVNVETI